MLIEHLDEAKLLRNLQIIQFFKTAGYFSSDLLFLSFFLP